MKNLIDQVLNGDSANDVLDNFLSEADLKTYLKKKLKPMRGFEVDISKGSGNVAIEVTLNKKGAKEAFEFIEASLVEKGNKFKWRDDNDHQPWLEEKTFDSAESAIDWLLDNAKVEID